MLIQSTAGHITIFQCVILSWHEDTTVSEEKLRVSVNSLQSKVLLGGSGMS